MQDKKQIQTLFKTLAVIISYFIYSTLFLTIFNVNDENPLFPFLADLVYFLIIFKVYYKVISNDVKKMIENFKENIKTILKWLGITIICQMVSVILLNSLLPDMPSNTSALNELPIYHQIFKMMIFACITEELVFKKALYDVIENKKLFIIISSLFYAVMNVVYYDMSNISVLISAIPYFITSLILSNLYVKSDNITMTMITKFIYQFIPLTMMMVSL